MTKAEALKIAQKRQTTWFCPIIGRTCDTKCYCYQPCKAVNSNDPTAYYPVWAWCSHRDMVEVMNNV